MVDCAGRLVVEAFNGFDQAVIDVIQQGCVLPLALFNLFFSQALLHTVKDLDLSVYVRFLEPRPRKNS